MSDVEITAGMIVKHFKGQYYQILYIATHSETQEKMVVYKAMAGNQVWVRPYDMFISPVDKEKYPDIEQEFRFQILESSKNDAIHR